MVVNLPAVLWIFVGVISLQCSHCLTSVRANRRIRSGPKIISEIIELQEGTEETYLNCSTTINGTKVKVYWNKDDELISAPELQPGDVCPIYAANCDHDGKYTCFTYGLNSTVVILKEFVVKILEFELTYQKNTIGTNFNPCSVFTNVKPTQDNSACGNAGEELLQKSEICIVPTIHEYPCCHYHIPPPGMLHLSRNISSEVKSKCKLDTIKNPTPWQIDVRWNLTHNATWIWGWQVSLTGLDNNLGVQSCVQINSKNKLLNWTFDGLPFGGKYGIKVQALPSDLRNYIDETIVLPRKRDICKEIGRKCHWEICFPVEGVQQEKTSSVLTWRLSKYHKTQHDFEIYYKSSDVDCSDSGSRKVENKSRIVLNIHKCRRYYVKVRPIFSNAEQGTFSKAIVFFPPRRTTAGPAKPTTERYIDVIVSCTIAVGLLILGLIAVIFVKRKRKDTRDPLIWSDGPEVIPNPAHKTQLFIVHHNHCRTCKNVTHALANLLDRTGYFECVLDFCSMNEITERGMGWYEEKIKSCDKIIVVCTKDGKRMHDEKEPKKDGPYIFILNMMLGQMINHQNRNLQIVPVYFDSSSNDDVPFFLSEYECYSLPSHLRDLCSALRSEINFYADSSTDDTSNDMMQDISELKSTIEIMGQNHKGYRKLKLTETTSL